MLSHDNMFPNVAMDRILGCIVLYSIAYVWLNSSRIVFVTLMNHMKTF